MKIDLRDPNVVMKLSKLGCFHQSKLSFLRSFLKEFKDWKFSRDLFELNDVLTHGSSAKIEMEDGASSILVNSDVTDFFLAGQQHLKIETLALKVP